MYCKVHCFKFKFKHTCCRPSFPVWLQSATRKALRSASRFHGRRGLTVVIWCRAHSRKKATSWSSASGPPPIALLAVTRGVAAPPLSPSAPLRAVTTCGGSAEKPSLRSSSSGCSLATAALWNSGGTAPDPARRHEAAAHTSRRHSHEAFVRGAQKREQTLVIHVRPVRADEHRGQQTQQRRRQIELRSEQRRQVVARLISPKFLYTRI